MSRKIILDLRVLAALVSMLARKHFLSNLHSPNSELWCQAREQGFEHFFTS